VNPAEDPVATVAPVVVCGGGPVGLALALELGYHGIRCVVIEPRMEPTSSRPRAKTLNVRTLEHLRRWGLADRLRERAPLPTGWSQDIAFATTLLGEEIARFTGVLGLSPQGLSPELGQQLPQYVLEAFLREQVAALPTGELRLGQRVTSVHQDADSVTVTVSDGDGSEQQISCRYLVGADGGRSRVRDAIGARYVGTQALRPNTGVVFRCPELMERLPHPPAVQTWLLNREVPGLMGPVDLHGTWWLIAFGVDGTVPTLDPEALVRGALGAVGEVEAVEELGADLPVDVVSTDPWTARMELVDRARVGRVFLIGDAAHLNPPFGGHGLNTGIGDAVDLGWKLAATLHGWAGPELLDSHEAERRPLQQRVIDEATANNAVLSNDLASSDRQLAAWHIATRKSAEYYSVGLVLGHRYTASPIIAGCAEPSRQDHWAAPATPGRRVPHLWTAPGVSTLDLAGTGYTALAAPATDLRPLLEAAAGAGLPLAATRVTSDVMAALGADVVVLRPDHVVAWAGAAALADPAALVRIVTGNGS